MKNKKYFEQVEAYFENKLSVEEKHEFENRASKDEALKEAMDRYKMASQAVDLLSEEAMQKKFVEWRREEGLEKANEGIIDFQKRTLNLQRVSSRVRYIAAAVFVLFTSLVVYYWSGALDQEEKYFVALSQPLPADNFRSEQDVIFLNAFEAYEQKEFEKALSNFNKIENPDDQVKYYFGHCHYLAGNYSKAEALFKQIIETDETSYKEEAEWALLASFKKGEKEEAFEDLLLRIRSNSKHSFYQQALELGRDH